MGEHAGTDRSEGAAAARAPWENLSGARGEALPGARGEALPGAPLPAAWFARPATDVAPALLGVLLVRQPTDGEPSGASLVARIVEAEAYTEDDPACHASRGRTPGNAPLFGPPGTAYVYRSYGVHWLFNVVTGAPGRGEGVLVRAAEPLAGWEAFRERRGSVADRDLLRGPGRLAQAFAIDGRWSGHNLCGPPPAALHLRDDGAQVPRQAGPRVGIAHAPDWPHRWVVPGSRWVSPYQRSPRAPR